MTNLARRLLLVTSLVLALAALGLTGFWLYGAKRIEANVEQWAEQWRAEGRTVQFRDFKVTGFPLYFRARLQDFAIGGGTPQAPWRWTAPTMQLRTSPFTPTRARASFAGEHRVEAELFGLPVSLTAAARQAEGRVQRRGDYWTGELDLRQAALRMAGTPGEAVVRQIDIDAFAVGQPVDHLTAAAGVTLALADVVLPQALAAGPLGGRIAAATLEARLMGSVGPTPDRAAIAAWRDAGGTVEVSRLELRWGPLRLSAEGTVALDGDLQPLGAFTATVAGFAETLDALAAAGTLGADEATSAKRLLSLLARTPLTGGPPQIAVPLAVQNQRVFIGPVPLFSLPRVEWPAT